jgi:hypothetical protein
LGQKISFEPKLVDVQTSANAQQKTAQGRFFVAPFMAPRKAGLAAAEQTLNADQKLGAFT